MQSEARHFITRRFRDAVALVLAYAGFSKLVGLSSDLQLLMGGLELVFGLALLRVPWTPRVNQALSLVFVFFAQFAFGKYILGAETCGCFGQHLQPSPLLMACFDSIIVILLWVTRPGDRSSLGLREGCAVLLGSALTCGILYAQMVVPGGSLFDGLTIEKRVVTSDWIGESFEPVLQTAKLHVESNTVLYFFSRENCEQGKERGRSSILQNANCNSQSAFLN